MAPEQPLRNLLTALADDVRLEMVRRLATTAGDQPCDALYDEIAKSTASYHFTTLREAGLIEQYRHEGRKLNRLRRDEADAIAPGLLDAVVAAVVRGRSQADAAPRMITTLDDKTVDPG